MLPECRSLALETNQLASFIAISLTHTLYHYLLGDQFGILLIAKIAHAVRSSIKLHAIVRATKL
jgi:hypothetical protein